MTIQEISRQVRRAQERKAVRKTMTKKERREYFRMPTALKREIHKATLLMIADGSIYRTEE